MARMYVSVQLHHALVLVQLPHASILVQLWYILACVCNSGHTYNFLLRVVLLLPCVCEYLL